mmetsp:Transcript_26608/g.67794  ORF Transcript_26608/g.67794 Transcript_26608/m.67794 type:complete len:225 (+) Transcript_26608:976-1650(+)
MPHGSLPSPPSSNVNMSRSLITQRPHTSHTLVPTAPCSQGHSSSNRTLAAAANNCRCGARASCAMHLIVPVIPVVVTHCLGLLVLDLITVLQPACARLGLLVLLHLSGRRRHSSAGHDLAPGRLGLVVVLLHLLLFPVLIPTAACLLHGGRWLESVVRGRAGSRRRGLRRGGRLLLHHPAARRWGCCRNLLLLIIKRLLNDIMLVGALDGSGLAARVAPLVVHG